ncbi:homolog of yeast ADA2 2A, partial [Prunus dulcis]
MIRVNSFFLRQRSYHFRRNWSYISFPFPFKSSYVFPRPFETPKNGQLPFLGTHTRFVTTKRIMVTHPLTTSFMNFIVIEIHVLP